MDDFWTTLVSYSREIGLGFDDGRQAVRIVGRLVLAMLLGGLVGWERERRGRAAGVRTHMLVALGAALFTVVAMESAADYADRPLVLSQVIRGIAAGVGFLGAGAILKGDEPGDVTGLTTAAGIWLTAAAGMAVGAGWFLPGAVGVLLSWIVLALSRVTDRDRP